jgi:hypothetical protein
MADDMLLGGYLIEPLSVVVQQWGIVEYLGVFYFGIDVQMRWTLKVT